MADVLGLDVDQITEAARQEVLRAPPRPNFAALSDDWKIAVAVAATLAVGAVVVVTADVPQTVFTAVLGLALMGAFVIALKLDTRVKS